MDFILNGQATGRVASTLLASNFNVGALRPYIGSDERHYITNMVGGKPVAIPLAVNAATLRQEEWKQIDTAVVAAATERLRVVADLRGAGLQYVIPNGMGKTVLETEKMSDITPASVSMDPARQSESDRPQFDIDNLPLPVIHKDFSFSARQVATSRNGGSPLDVTMPQLAARRVAEEAEKLTLGVSTNGVTYGGGTVYGFTNFPSRITKTDLTAPTDTGWTPAITVQEVLTMRQLSKNKYHFGPWNLYVSPAWDEYLDDDYSAAKGDITLRERLAKIEGIRQIATADFLTGFHMVLVQMTSDVARIVVGMDVMTIQWETQGGMLIHFKVMAILVPQLRADINGNTGIVHARPAA